MREYVLKLPDRRKAPSARASRGGGTRGSPFRRKTATGQDGPIASELKSWSVPSFSELVASAEAPNAHPPSGALRLCFCGLDRFGHLIPVVAEQVQDVATHWLEACTVADKCSSISFLELQHHRPLRGAGLGMKAHVSLV